MRWLFKELAVSRNSQPSHYELLVVLSPHQRKETPEIGIVVVRRLKCVVEYTCSLEPGTSAI